jgi:hypothetical protein
LMMGNFEAVLFFAIVAYLSTFFTKNMVIVFLVSILATNFLMVSKVNYFSRMNPREGMQNKEESEEEKDAETAAPEPKKKAAAATTSDEPKPTSTNSKKTSGEKKKEGMNGNLAPAKFNDDSDDDADVSPFPGNNQQRNAQMERAHDSLQNIGATSGGMNMKTEEVMKQQQVLMDNIKTMQPFLETAERFLDKFNMKGIDGLLGKIGMGSGNATPGS